MKDVRIVSMSIETANPLKIEACQTVGKHFFNENFVLESFDIGVKNTIQPMSDEETITWAINRAKLAIDRFNTDYGIGIESGVRDYDNDYMFLTVWAAVIDKAGEVGLGSGGYHKVPERFATRVRQGEELGPVIDEYLSIDNTKQKDETNDFLVRGSITRGQAIKTALTYAFYRFINQELYL